jgi:hypothetical protein
MLDELAGSAAIEPFKLKLLDAVNTGWKRWTTIPIAERKCLTATTRANMVRDFIVDEVTRVFANEKLVERIDKGLRILFRIKGKCLLIFKKLDEDGFGRNYPTQTALSFERQENLPGIPVEPRLHVGYTLNPAGSSIGRVLLSHLHKDKRKAWVTELRDDSTAAVRSLVTTTSQPQMPVKRRVQAKNKKLIKKKDATGE